MDRKSKGKKCKRGKTLTNEKRKVRKPSTDSRARSATPGKDEREDVQVGIRPGDLMIHAGLRRWT
jgi:hypothetical protein